jgi:hypothetical protein
MPARYLVASPAPISIVRDATLELAPRGKSAINRAAIDPGSRCTDGPSGSAAINDANLVVAVSPGNPANFTASCQGSRSSRASAEMTLSSIPLFSSPIGADRKSSNSDPSLVAQTERVISTTEFRRLYRTHKTDNEAWGSTVASTLINTYRTAEFHVRHGNI